MHKNEAVVLFTCDEWKTRSTFHLVGVFTDDKALRKVLRKMAKEGDIVIQGKLPDMDIYDMQGKIDYASLEIVDLNEEV